MSVTAVKDFLSPEALQEYGQTQQADQSEVGPEGQTGQLTAQSEANPEDQAQQTSQPEDQTQQTSQPEDQTQQTGQPGARL